MYFVLLAICNQFITDPCDRFTHICHVFLQWKRDIVVVAYDPGGYGYTDWYEIKAQTRTVCILCMYVA